MTRLYVFGVNIATDSLLFQRKLALSDRVESSLVVATQFPTITSEIFSLSFIQLFLSHISMSLHFFPFNFLDCWCCWLLVWLLKGEKNCIKSNAVENYLINCIALLVHLWRPSSFFLLNIFSYFFALFVVIFYASSSSQFA